MQALRNGRQARRHWRPACCGCYDGGMTDELSDPTADRPGGVSLDAALRLLPLPPLTVGVYAISAICGMLDAATFLKLGHAFVETMTGNILLLAFTVGVRATGQPAPALPDTDVLPYLVALARFAVGAIAGGRLVQAGEPGRRAGFAADAVLIGLAALAAVLTHPSSVGRARYLVIGILSFAMGIQNALMRRWGIRDLATNVMTLTLCGLLAESTLGGGTNPGAVRRATSIGIFLIGAIIGGAISGYGVVWPILAAFVIFSLALVILMQSPDA